MKKIKVKSIGSAVKERDLFRKEIYNRLGEDLFHITNKYELLFKVLKEFDITYRGLKNEEKSIEDRCEKVLNILHDRRYSKVKVTDLTNNTTKEFSNAEGLSVSDQFLKLVLHLKKLPAEDYFQLAKSVRVDLIKIEKLIEWYESQEPIKRYINNNEKPRNHDSRVYLDYYKRCIVEQKKILKYYLYDLGKRALAKSHFLYGTMVIPTWSWFDKPYEFATFYAESYFDCRKIDQVLHRVPNIYVGEEEMYNNLYYNDKPKFYKQLFKKEPPEQLFNSINFYLQHLPLKSDRTTIFKALEGMFIKKNWIGFYATALVQVEGLFGEMQSIATDKKSNSLPDKVEAIRSFSHYKVFLDYYQYHIPNIRNKFSHSGIDDDYQYKSYDLLVDLCRLLQMFYELDNPFVKVKKLHVKRDPKDFYSIPKFAAYFVLLNSLRREQYLEIEKDIKIFESDFLISYCDIEYMCGEEFRDLQNRIGELITELEKYYPLQNSINITTEDLNSLKLKLQDNEIADSIKDFYNINLDKYATIKSAQIFLSSFKKYLPSLNTNIEKSLMEYYINNRNGLSKITAIGDCLNIEFLEF